MSGDCCTLDDNCGEGRVQVPIAGVPFSGVGYDLSRKGPYWPGGEYSYGHEDLCHLLLTAAQDNANRTLVMFVSDDRMLMLQAAVAAGTAVELASKAALVSIEPALLCERSHVDSLLHLSGNGGMAETPATELRTLGGLDAFRLCKRLMKCAAGISEASARRALNVRNAALHLALVNRQELRAAVADSIRIVDQLVVGIGAERDSFWKSHVELVDKLIVEQQAQVAHIIAAKVQAAREQLARITAALTPEVAAAVLAQRSRCLSSSDHEEPVDCPVCGQEAWLICGVEEDEPQCDAPEEGWWFVHSTAWPFAFECSVCGLSLDDSELGEFEFPEYVDLEPELVNAPDQREDWDD